MAIPILIAVILVAIQMGAGMMHFRQHVLSAGGGTLHSPFILGVILVFSGIMNLILCLKESVFLSLGEFSQSQAPWLMFSGILTLRIIQKDTT
jgi:hypothetical protein